MIKKILITIGIIILLAGSNALTWYLSKCDKTTGTVESGKPGPLSPTGWTKDDPAAKYCGSSIDITGAIREGNFFVTARDDCKFNTREFPMKAICPRSYRPYSIMIQPFILAGYQKELKRFNALAGAELTFLWNYSRGSVGISVLYAQGLMVDEYYVGAAFAGKVDFGKLKN